MHGTHIKWLKELEDETNTVISKEINDEAHGNMVIFGFTDELLEVWGKYSLSDFLIACASLYKIKNKKKNNGANMIFYSWFDE